MTNAGKLLVVESDDALRAQIVAVLNQAGYEVSTRLIEAGMKSILCVPARARRSGRRTVVA